MPPLSVLPFLCDAHVHSQYIMSLPVGASIEMEGRKILDKHMTIIAIYNMLPGLPQRQQTAD